MSSFNSTIDGMGFEEMGQPGSQPVNVWLAGSLIATIVSGGEVLGHHISGNEFIGGTFDGTTYSNSDGTLQSIGIDNATTVYGYKIQAGSVKTGDDASGLINFKTPFSSAHWFMTVTPRTLTNPYLYQVTDGSGLVPCVSGIRRASGCWIYGGSQTVYDWIAVGN